MFDENAHAGAVESYGELARYLIAAMETLGKENALQIHEKAFEMQGAGIETMLRSMHPEVNLEELGKMFEETLNSTGFESESFMEDENTVIIRNTRCPRYDSFKMNGIDDETIEEYCLRGVSVLDRYFKKVDPSLEFTVPVWDASNGRCDEKIYRTR